MASSIPVVQAALQERFLVAAIDFGTTYSGYAFSFKHEYKDDPLRVNTNQWTSASKSFMSLKTASCILFDPDRNFSKFGFEADLAMDDKHKNWFFYKNFKMLLYDKQNLKMDIDLEDDKGLHMPAMDVFSAAIRYLKDHMISSLKEDSSGLFDSEIHWVLTVPAIWDAAAKQFMREAAVTSSVSFFALTGGTVDITVHEVQRDGTMKELYKANCGPWGGTTIDVAYIEFFIDVMGKDLMDKFNFSFKDDYLEFIREFELQKRIISPNMDQKVTFKIPISMTECLRELHGHDFRQSLNLKNELAGKMKFTGDKMRVDVDVVKGFFEETCNQIVRHLQDVFSNAVVRNTDTILMVGGFSESPMLRNAVQKAFSNMRIILPQDASLAVLRGAVIYGHNPAIITARVCRFTYGVDTTELFRENRDPPGKLLILNGVKRCKDRFSKYVEVGQQVEIDQEFAGQTYFPLYGHVTGTTFSIYTSYNVNPQYVDEDGCRKLGVLRIEYEDQSSGLDRPVEVKMKYGGTEFGVTAVEVNTGQIVHAKFDFLG